MTTFADTAEGQKFIASGPSRETDTAIMEAIAFFARNANEAEDLWNGDGFGRICHPSDLWERVTSNGRRDASEFSWGSAGSQWWDHIQAAA